MKDDYIMNVLLGYYEESKGKTRSERFRGTLRTVGSLVLIDGLSTFVGVLPLAFSSSAVVRTVFIRWESVMGSSSCRFSGRQ